jgi:hypothetical protein
MLNIMLILTWIVAFGLAMYLATRAIKFRLRGRQQKKLERRKLRDFMRHHRFDERQHRWVRKDDGVVLVDEVIEDRRLNLVVLGWLAFVLWEGYWFWEIAQRYFETNRLELPYMFLFFILVVTPWPCICSFDGESGGQRAGPLAASHILTLKLQILKRLLHEACQHAD